MPLIFYYNNCYAIATNCNPIYDLSSNFHIKIATQLYKIISDSVVCVCVCMCVYVYVYIYMHTYTHTYMNILYVCICT